MLLTNTWSPIKKGSVVRTQTSATFPPNGQKKQACGHAWPRLFGKYNLDEPKYAICTKFKHIYVNMLAANETIQYTNTWKMNNKALKLAKRSVASCNS